MKFEICSLKYLAVLAVMAGCATEEPNAAKVETAATPVAKAAEKAPAAQSESFDAQYQKHIRAVRNYHCHMFPDEAMKGVAPALAFLEKNADKAASHAGQFEELKYQCLVTLHRGRDFEMGIPYAKDMYANSKNSTHRIFAAYYLGLGMIDKSKDYAGADKFYVDILEKIRGVSGQHFATLDVVGRRAGLYVMRKDKAGALKYLEEERAKLAPASLAAKDRYWFNLFDRGIDDKIAGVYGAFFDYQGEVDYFLKRGDKGRVFGILSGGLLSDVPLATKLAHELVLAGGNPGAWCWLYSRDEKFCEANAKLCFTKEKSSTNNFADVVGRTIAGANLSSTYGALTPAYDRNPEITAKLWKHYVSTKKLLKYPVEFRIAQYATLAYAELGDKPNAIAAATDGLANEKIRPEERFELALMKRLLELKGSEDQIAAATKAAIAELSKGVDAKLVKRYMQRACAVATVSRDEALKRGVAKFYLKEIRATLPKKSYTVKFTDRNVAGAGDWVNLPFKPEESDFERKYGGGGMAFMTTDVATGDRGNAVVGGAKARKYPTTLQAVADEWGLHVVFTFYDRRARQFESGELDCGSYESYIAPGENTPYTCFLNYPKKDAAGHVMNTSYNQPGHRRVNPKDPTKFRTDTIFTDDAVITYVAFSWDVFVDKLPTNGAEWDFESVFWGPVPSAWNGTESIHGRSTWGKLKFELSDAALVKIRRAQLFKAVNAYKAEKLPKQVSPDSVQEGLFSHWSDDELGDVEFYEKELKPLMAELDPVAARVKVGMSDADVTEIAEKYLTRFADLRFEVARLRTQFMAKKLTTK